VSWSRQCPPWHPFSLCLVEPWAFSNMARWARPSLRSGIPEGHGRVRWHRGPKPRLSRNPCFSRFPNSTEAAHAAGRRRYPQIAFSGSQGPGPWRLLGLGILTLNTPTEAFFKCRNVLLRSLDPPSDGIHGVSGGNP
jgi:hypothetical protein